MQIWVYIALVSGFLGFYTLFIDINIFIKILAIYGFLNCFLSSCPLISFKDYPILIGCIYLYWLLTKLKHWEIVFKLILTLIIFNLFFVIIQLLNKDSLLNWGLSKNSVEGTLRNPMQLKSLIIVALAFIVAYKKPKFIKNKWFIALLIIGSISYLFFHKVFHYFPLIRLGAWKEAFRIYLLHPLFGWGMSSFKFIFPALSEGYFKGEGLWLQAHNDWLQILFEMGVFGFLITLAFVGNLVIRLRKYFYILVGLVMIVFDMMVHFPLHMISTVLIIIAFLAYCNKEVLDVR